MARQDDKDRATGALSGVRVIDLSRVLGGPLCTQILADHGADVIKVEPPQGDDTRAWGPPFREKTAAYYIGLNRNKRAIVLDLSTSKGREVLFRLLETADVLVENFKSGTLEKWGIGFATVLQPRFPRLIHCRVSGFGDAGPFGGLVGYDAVVQAISGLMSINGGPEMGATRIGVPIVDMTTGLNAAIGIMLALFDRTQSGKGQSVEAALFDSAISLLHPHSANWLLGGEPPKLTGSAHPNVAPYEKFRTTAGEFFLGIGNNAQFRTFCDEVGRPDLAGDPRFATNHHRVANRPALREAIQAAIADRQPEELCRQLLNAGVPAGVVMSIPESLTHPQTAAREMVVEQDGYRGAGVPIKLSRTPGGVRSAPPALGADTREILEGCGYSLAEIEALLADKVAFAAGPTAPVSGSAASLERRAEAVQERKANL
jgi:formyl-CoA transferase